MRTRAKFSFFQDNILIISLEINKVNVLLKIIISNHKLIMIALQCNL